MRYFVLTPLAAFLLLMLLLLMVHLAGLNRPAINQPLILSEAPFELNSISFEKNQTTGQHSESTPEEVLELSDSGALVPSFDTMLEATELPVLEPYELESEPVQELTPEINLDIALLDSVLDNVAISPPVPIKKRVSRSKKTEKKAFKKALKTARPQKTAKRQSRQLKQSKQSKREQSVNQGSLQGKGVSSTPTAGNKSITAPSALSKVKPKYPSRARRRGIEGEVVVAFQVMANGQVQRKSIRVMRAKPKKVFNKAVISAISRWRFPASASGYRSTQKLVFSLDK